MRSRGDAPQSVAARGRVGCGRERGGGVVIFSVRLVGRSGARGAGCGGGSDGTFSGEFGEERAVMNHGLAQVFGIGAALGVEDGDLVTGAVVFDDERMMGGEIGGALFEIGDGIAADGHDLLDELVGIDESALGIVDETGLDAIPGGVEIGADFGRERIDFEGVDATGECFELGFGFGRAAGFLNGALVFGAEAAFEASAAHGAAHEEKHEDDDDGDDDGERGGVGHAGEVPLEC